MNALATESTSQVEAPDERAGEDPPPGRDRAFAELFRAHHQRVLAYLLRRAAEPETARDLTAEVFRLAWERALAGDLPGPPWLFVAARYLLANSNRAEASRRRAQGALVGELTRDPNWAGAAGSPAGSPPPGLLDADDLGERVRLTLGSLPDAQRELLTAYYWDSLSGAECAALLGCSAPAVWMRLTRARAAFKDLFTASEEKP
ncbi:MAG: sigma-70 family RNA polymerase sigma factor [Bifidobacteriaceae bacterium]|nr:sigma-70 family RNA polymerase sigma factor [Bifidobacteriaceae bacterium]